MYKNGKRKAVVSWLYSGQDQDGSLQEVELFGKSARDVEDGSSTQMHVRLRTHAENPDLWTCFGIPPAATLPFARPHDLL